MTTCCDVKVYKQFLLVKFDPVGLWQKKKYGETRFQQASDNMHHLFIFMSVNILNDELKYITLKK